MKILEKLDVSIPTDATILKMKTVFFGYSDLKGAVEALEGEATPAAIMDRLSKRSPATSFLSYLRNIRSDEAFPEDEFIGLMDLAKEVNRQEDLRKVLDDHNELREKLRDCAEVEKALSTYFQPPKVA